MHAPVPVSAIDFNQKGGGSGYRGVPGFRTIGSHLHYIDPLHTLYLNIFGARGGLVPGTRNTTGVGFGTCVI